MENVYRFISISFIFYLSASSFPFRNSKQRRQSRRGAAALVCSINYVLLCSFTRFVFHFNRLSMEMLLELQAATTASREWGRVASKQATADSTLKHHHA